MAAYLIQLRARSGWTSIVRELTDVEAALIVAVADDLTMAADQYGAEMSVKPVADCDQADLDDATWVEDDAAERLITHLPLPDNDEGPAVSATEPSDQNPGRN